MYITGAALVELVVLLSRVYVSLEFSGALNAEGVRCFQERLTPKAFANFSPWLERSNNHGITITTA